MVLAYANLFWERFWPLLVPAFMVVCVFLTVSWFGLWRISPDWLRWGLLAGFVCAFILALFPLGGFRRPSRREALARIEKESAFEHRPVTAQVDRMAGGDEFSSALWNEHRRRMAEKLANMSSGVPRPDANRFDRFALRAMLPLLVFVAYGFSYSLDGGRISDSIKPAVDRQLVLSRLDVWINSPTYTGKPPVYLTKLEDANRTISTLRGSELQIRYFGDEAIVARLRNDSASVDYSSKTTGEGDVRETRFVETLDRSGVLEIAARDEVIAAWPLSVLEDREPSIRFDDPPGTGESGALELAYSVEDDYGVVAARGIIRPLDDAAGANARPLVEAPELSLPLPRARAKKGSTRINRDFSEHPWAGSQVELTLEAVDDAEQTGRSNPFNVTLPGRGFFDPMARAIVEQRRILSLDANKAPYVANLLDATTAHPDVFDIDAGAYIALQSAYRMIVQPTNDDRLRDALDLLWETALAIELGDMSEVERKLREAQEKLSDALENGASEAEIERLMEELRQAMNDYLEQLAREMARNPIQQNPANPMQDMQTMTQRDLERMMDRIEDLAKSGSQDAARELLSELQRMMESLRAGQHMQQRQAEGNELNQALDKLSELMQEQENLMNETFDMERRRPQQQPGQNNQGQQNQQSQNGQQQPGQSGEPMSPEEFAEALRQLQERQEALRQQLGELGEQLEGLGLDPSKEFGEAQGEMGEAEGNLGEGQAGQAAGDQGQALQALRQGAQSMMQQMAGDRGQGGQQQGPNGQVGNNQSGTDPLGRRTGPRGQVNDDSTRIPGEIDAQRAREIMDAIRERLSDPLRPLLERRYLERLLESE